VSITLEILKSGLGGTSCRRNRKRGLSGLSLNSWCSNCFTKSTAGEDQTLVLTADSPWSLVSSNWLKLSVVEAWRGPKLARLSKNLRNKRSNLHWSWRTRIGLFFWVSLDFCDLDQFWRLRNLGLGSGFKDDTRIWQEIFRNRRIWPFPNLFFAWEGLEMGRTRGTSAVDLIFFSNPVHSFRYEMWVSWVSLFHWLNSFTDSGLHCFPSVLWLTN
jgi:hypothetical protein